MQVVGTHIMVIITDDDALVLMEIQDSIEHGDLDYNL